VCTAMPIVPEKIPESGMSGTDGKQIPGTFLRPSSLIAADRRRYLLSSPPAIKSIMIIY
jgi:hypothetical protein